MTFDLATIDLKADSEAGAWIHLRDPRTGLYIYADKEKTKPCRIHSKGPHSDAVRAVTEAVSKRREKREAERAELDARGNVTKRGESTKEELVADDVEIYSAAADGWENLAFQGDEKFSKETAAKLFAALDWARTQFLQHLVSTANFIQEPGSGS